MRMISRCSGVPSTRLGRSIIKGFGTLKPCKGSNEDFLTGDKTIGKHLTALENPRVIQLRIQKTRRVNILEQHFGIMHLFCRLLRSQADLTKCHDKRLTGAGI